VSRARYATLARLAAWSGIGVLVAIRAGLTALPPAEEVAGSWLLSLAPILLGVVATTIACRTVHGEERRFWVLLAVATGLVLVGECYFVYTVIAVDPLGPPIAHPVLILYAGAVAAFLAMLVSMTRFGAEPLVVRSRFYVDIALAFVVGFVAAYRWLITPLFSAIPDASTALLLVGSAYPVFGLTLIIGTLAVLVGFKASRWRPWERLFTASLAIYAAGIFLWPWWVLDRRVSASVDSADSVLDILFMIGFYLLFVAAIYRLTESEARPVPRGVSAPLGRWPWFAPVYLGSVVLCVPLLVWSVAHATTQEEAGFYLWSVVVLVSLLGIRSWLVGLEGTYLFAATVTDPVTGVANRRAFEAALPVAVSAHSEAPVSTIAFDIDGFGTLNEIAGHAEGDRVLREVAGALQQTLGPRGKLYSLGADDLVALLPGIDTAAAAELAGECALGVERQVSWRGMAVTVSAGVASAPEHATEGEDLLRKAMSAEEWARAAGGARVRVFDEAEGHLVDPAERLARIRRGDHLSTVRAIAAAVDSRDPNAPEHSRDVARAAVALARETGMGEERLALVETAAFLHDIGKLAVEDAILSAHEELTQAQRDQVEGHPVFGETILRSAGIDEILPWVRHHHERWDGAGYPDGLSGSQIPLEARIIAVADAYEVMVYGRPYQPALGHHAALRQIELEGGTHFDPSLASAFVKVMWDTVPFRSAPPASAHPSLEASGERSAE
jgi:diguanylate cyclase (GGDEF)-like protein/putative nucleotidyltransferase with HDIG domain